MHLYGELVSTTTVDFASLEQLIGQLKSKRNTINDQPKSVLGIELISKERLLTILLFLLPRHHWATIVNFSKEGYNLDIMESKLCAIFDGKSKSEIMNMTPGKSFAANTVSVGAPFQKKGKVVQRKGSVHVKVRRTRGNPKPPTV